jgi:hypothetical protein
MFIIKGFAFMASEVIIEEQISEWVGEYFQAENMYELFANQANWQ